MIVVSNDEPLKNNLLEIQNFTDEQIKFYNENEENYYSKILEIVEFIKSTPIEILMEAFSNKKNQLKDFKESFIELYNYENYYRGSAKKTNFFNSIKELVEVIKSQPSLKKAELTLVEKKLKEYKDEFLAIKNTLDNYEETFTIYDKKIKEKEKYLEKINTEVSEIKKNAENQVKAFTEKIKLDKAATYWKSKSKWHLGKAFASFLIFIVLICSIGWITWNKIETSISQDINKAPMQVFLEKNSTQLKMNPQLLEHKKMMERHEIIRYMQYLFLLSLVIWLSRILLKITFSNLHLKEEAHEKEMMILTYLALINEGAGLKDDDRKSILEAIFRPSTNGLIKDESNVTLLDIGKVLKGK